MRVELLSGAEADLLDVYVRLRGPIEKATVTDFIAISM